MYWYRNLLTTCGGCRSGSTLAKVMACCLAAPRHYLKQCGLTISTSQWHSMTSCTAASIHLPHCIHIHIQICIRIGMRIHMAHGLLCSVAFGNGWVYRWPSELLRCPQACASTSEATARVGQNKACTCQSVYIEGILPKWPYLPCVSMAGGALLAEYPRHVVERTEFCLFNFQGLLSFNFILTPHVLKGIEIYTIVAWVFICLAGEF